MRRWVRAALLMSLALVGASARGDGVTLTGRVLAERGAPIKYVHVAVSAGDTRVADREVELGSDGDLRLSLGPHSGPTLRCRISSAGFDPVELTAVRRGDAAALGTVRLKPYVELGPLVAMEHANESRTSLDIWLTHHTSRNLVVRRIVVVAAEPRAGSCFDSGPALTLRFDRIAAVQGDDGSSGAKLTASLRVLDDSRPPSSDQFRVGGEFHRDACGRSTVRVESPFSFALTQADRDRALRVRVDVPKRLSLPGIGVVAPGWQDAEVHLELESGEVLSVHATH